MYAACHHSSPSLPPTCVVATGCNEEHHAPALPHRCDDCDVGQVAAACQLGVVGHQHVALLQRMDAGHFFIALAASIWQAVCWRHGFTQCGCLDEQAVFCRTADILTACPAGRLTSPAGRLTSLQLAPGT